MQTKKCLFLIFAVLFLVSSVSAQQELVAFNQEIASENPSLVLDVIIFSDGSAYLSGRSNINPNLPVTYLNGKVSGKTQQLTSKQGETWRFSLETKETFDFINVRIVLPKNAKLITGTISSNSPPLLYTNDGSIVVEILDNKVPLDISFSYEVPLTNGNDYSIAWIYGIAFAIAFAIVFWIMQKKRKPNAKTKKAITKKRPVTKEAILTKFKRRFKNVRHLLNEREISIVEALIQLKGKAKGNQLQKYTKIPKAAFSRHIATLEAKNLISKKSLGRSNLVMINVE